MLIKEIINHLESFAPSAYQESYDNARLITGNKNWECTGALTTLDCLEATIEEAINKKCNLIVAHHPIVFSGLKSITGKNYIERTIIKAIKNDVAIYAIHTNLDNVQNGVNKVIADKLKLKNQSILSPKKTMLKKLFTFCPTNKVEEIRAALFEAGAGNIGNYSSTSFNIAGTGTFKANENAQPYVGEKNKLHLEEETKIETVFEAYKQHQIVKALIETHPYDEVAYDIISSDNQLNNVGSGIVGVLADSTTVIAFLTTLKQQFKCGCIKYTQPHKEEVKRIAVCGGSGSFLLNDAKAAKADVFITSDYKYHQFFDADNQIIIADIGHYESEQYTADLLYEILTQKFRNFAVFISGVNTNPVNYL